MTLGCSSSRPAQEKPQNLGLSPNSGDLFGRVAGGELDFDMLSFDTTTEHTALCRLKPKSDSMRMNGDDTGL